MAPDKERRACPDCIKTSFEEMVKVVYDMKGKLTASTASNYFVIVIGIILTALTYMGNNAQANDVKENTAGIKTIKESLESHKQADITRQEKLDIKIDNILTEIAEVKNRLPKK